MDPGHLHSVAHENTTPRRPRDLMYRPHRPATLLCKKLSVSGISHRWTSSPARTDPHDLPNTFSASPGSLFHLGPAGRTPPLSRHCFVIRCVATRMARALRPCALLSKVGARLIGSATSPWKHSQSPDNRAFVRSKSRTKMRGAISCAA